MSPSRTSGGFPWYFCFLLLAGALVLKPFWGRPHRVVEGELAQASTSVEADLNCHCKIRGETFNELTFEKPDECGGKRNYLEGSLAALKKQDANGFYTQTRVDSKKIPRKCFLFAMKHTFPVNFKKPSFASCGQAEQKTVAKPCVTEALVDLVYNSYLDTMDCFDLPTKAALPKFMNESGVLPNVLQRDGSVGFLPMPANVLQILKDDYASWSLQIRSSKKASCARLLSLKGAMPASAGHIHPMNPLTCSGHTNPLRDMIYYGAYHKLLQKEVEGRLAQADVRRLMERLKMDEASEHAIKKILVTISFDTGPKSVIYFREWLRYRILKFPQIPLEAKDFGFDHEGARSNAMTFSQWLGVAKKKFRTASNVKFFADRLDANFGEGVCTESKFLEL